MEVPRRLTIQERIGRARGTSVLPRLLSRSDTLRCDDFRDRYERVRFMAQSPPSVADPNDAFRLERCQQRLGYRFRDPQLAVRGADACLGGRPPAVVERAAGVSGRRDPGPGGVRAVVPPVSGAAGRRPHEAQVDRRQPADVREDQPGAGAARVPGAGQRDDDAPGRAAIGACPTCWSR